MSTADEILAAASDALVHWDIDAPTIAVLSHTENIVCRVDYGPGPRRVLRLHRPGYNSLGELRSEIAWAESLASFGLTVATPVPLPNGGHHVEVTVDGQPSFASVIEWIEGHPLTDALTSEPSTTTDWYHRLGVIAATIRAHGQTWTPPAWFQRRSWDADGLLGENPLWGRFWESPALDTDQQHLFDHVRSLLRQDLDQITTDPSTYGLIHADLHSDNLMVHDGNLTVIDFDDAGFGYYSHELAVGLRSLLDTEWLEPATESLAEGYASIASDADRVIAEVDTFLTIRCLMLVGWLDQRPTIALYQYRDQLALQAEAAANRYLDRRQR
ncbi:MAG: phosphotransferase [Actinomycetia bacterium]|nr:phosphotransferase [Actinomycetes bacterium]MCP4960287.1 phosphotransferase [Actinomycetes bacterium]